MECNSTPWFTWLLSLGRIDGKYGSVPSRLAGISWEAVPEVGGSKFSIFTESCCLWCDQCYVTVDFFSNFSNLLPEILAILPTGCRDESTTVQRMRHRLRQTTTCKTRNMQAMTYQVNGTLRLRRRPPDGWK